jgi:phosphohistidine phosphatase SixA
MAIDRARLLTSTHLCFDNRNKTNTNKPMDVSRKSLVLILTLAIIAVGTWVSCFWWPRNAHPITTIYISRHAEKLNSTDNPSLSEIGKVRAAELAHVLKNESIDAVFVTQFLRTQQTGGPTALQSNLKMVEYKAGSPKDVANAILTDHLGDQVLVVGHSNTVDDIAANLGVSGVPELAGAQYDRLFVVTRFGSTAHLNLLRYGSETP